MQVEMGKQYRTRGGSQVRLYCVDGGGRFPVHGAMRYGDYWQSASWTKDGQYWADSPRSDDLIEVKPRIQLERWCNIYRDESGCHHLGSSYKDKETATRIGKDNNTIAVVKITIDCEEGEGL